MIDAGVVPLIGVAANHVLPPLVVCVVTENGIAVAPVCTCSAWLGGTTWPGV